MREEDLPATVRWTNQSSNRLKANWDAVINFQEKITGIGVVIRDNLRRVFVAQSKTIPAIYELDSVGEIAVLHAIEPYRDSGVKEVVFEGDLKNVVTALNESEPSLCHYGQILDDAKVVLGAI